MEGEININAIRNNDLIQTQNSSVLSHAFILTCECKLLLQAGQIAGVAEFINSVNNATRIKYTNSDRKSHETLENMMNDDILILSKILA